MPGSAVDLLRFEVTVPVPPAAALAAFTDEIGAWWPDPEVEIALDARPDGALTWMWGCDVVVLAEVVAADPGTSITLAWRVVPGGHPLGAGPRAGAGAGTVAIRTAPVDDDLTTVIVEHHGLAGDDGRAVRRWATGDDGWWTLLRAYAAHTRR